MRRVPLSASVVEREEDPIAMNVERRVIPMKMSSGKSKGVWKNLNFGSAMQRIMINANSNNKGKSGIFKLPIPIGMMGNLSSNSMVEVIAKIANRPTSGRLRITNADPIPASPTITQSGESKSEATPRNNPIPNAAAIYINDGLFPLLDIINFNL
jgi:hypothetical protein